MKKNIEVLTMKVKDIKTEFGNPRKISKKKRKELEQSLETYGDFGLFIVDESDNVIAGNQRLQILKERDGNIEVLVKKLVGYTESEKRAINIKDNVHQGEWDLDLLAEWTADITIDLGLELTKDIDNRSIDAMELIHYEKYDYVLIVCKDELSYNSLVRTLGIEEKKVLIGPKKRPIKGRAIWFDDMAVDLVPKAKSK
jgi:hypothetical protein